ncbi:hypothetical protein [Methylobacterium sp. CM6246]
MVAGVTGNEWIDMGLSFGLVMASRGGSAFHAVMTVSSRRIEGVASAASPAFGRSLPFLAPCDFEERVPCILVEPEGALQHRRGQADRDFVSGPSVAGPIPDVRDRSGEDGEGIGFEHLGPVR